MYQELQKGWIEVICGPMFAGKSEELIRRIKTLSYAHQKIIAYKPSIDNRYDDTAIASHNGGKYQDIRRMAQGRYNDSEDIQRNYRRI